MHLRKTVTPNRRVLGFDMLDPKGLVCLGHYRYIKMDRPPLLDHIHEDSLEICYLENGYQTYVVDQKEFHLKGGDAFVTFPNEIHGSGHFVVEKASLYWIQIQTFNIRNLLDLPSKDSEFLIDRLNFLPLRNFKGNQRWKEIFENIFALRGSRDKDYCCLKLRQLVVDLLLDCIELSGKGTKANSAIDLDIEKSLGFIHKNIDQVFSVKDVADSCFLSESHFKSKFKKNIGISPLDYIQRKKIERSKELIRAGKLSLTEIATHLGFSSSQYFSTVFKKYTGKMPSKFK